MLFSWWRITYTLICFEVWCNFSFKLKRALLELNHDIVSAGALDVG